MVRVVCVIVFIFLLSGLNPVFAQHKKKNKQQTGASDTLAAEKIFMDAEKYFMLEDYAKAYSLFQKSADLLPGNAAAHYKMAQVLYYEQDFDGALEAAIRAKTLNPKNKFYYKLVAESYRAINDLESAAKTYEELLEAIPSSQEVLLDLALIYLYVPNYRQALYTYDRAEKSLGFSEEIVLQKQKIHLKLNDIDGALEEARKLYDADPNNFNYLLNMVNIYNSNNRKSEAITLLEDFLHANPEEDRVFLELYLIYSDLNEHDTAETYLIKTFQSPKIDASFKAEILAEKILKLPNKDIKREIEELQTIALEVHPENAIILAIAGDFFLRNGNPEEARSYYLASISQNGNNFDVWRNILSISFDLEDFDGAVGYAEEALGYFPNQGYLHYINGVANYALEDYAKAADAFESSKKISRNNRDLVAEINARLGDTYHSLEEFDKSDASYEAALAYNPDFDHVLNNYSYFLSIRKTRLDEARKMSSRLVKRNPDNPTFLDTHGWVLYMLGEYKEALKYLEKAVAGDPSPVILEHYGDVLFKLGRVEEAVAQWEKAKGLDSTSELIDKKIADRKLYE
jgi:tetratricopeptide (TPR) repeat protein